MYAQLCGKFMQGKKYLDRPCFNSSIQGKIRSNFLEEKWNTTTCHFVQHYVGQSKSQQGQLLAFQRAGPRFSCFNKVVNHPSSQMVKGQYNGGRSAGKYILPALLTTAYTVKQAIKSKTGMSKGMPMNLVKGSVTVLKDSVALWCKNREGREEVCDQCGQALSLATVAFIRQISQKSEQKHVLYFIICA